jgi:hypothetical protein
MPKLATNFRNPPNPPLVKGQGGFLGNSSMQQYAFLVPARPGYEIIKIFLCFEFFTAEHAEIAESNIQKTKFKKVSSFCVFTF